MTCARRLAGARKPASPAGSPRRPDPRSGRLRARLSRFLPALALLLAALSPFAAAPAAAQSVWSADLTVNERVAGFPALGVGCDDDADTTDAYCENPGALSKDDEFTYNGITTSINTLAYGSSSIFLIFGSDIPEGHMNRLVLTVGTQSFYSAFQTAGGDSTGFTGNRFLFQGVTTDPGFTVGATLAVSLLQAAPRPTDLTAAAGGGKVTLSWQRGGPATSPRGDRYEIEYGEHPSGSLTMKQTGPLRAAAPEYEIGDLDPGTAYRFRVRTRGIAHNSIPHSRWSDWVTATPVSPPGLPRHLFAGAGDGQLTVDWAPPTASLTGYDVHYTASSTVAADAKGGSGANPATGWKAVDRGTETSPPTASQTIEGLTNRTEYRVRVRSRNATGESDWVETTGTPVPPAPSDLAVWGRSAKLDATWKAPPKAVTGYDVHITSAPKSGTGAVADDAEASGFSTTTAWVAITTRGADTTPAQELTGLTNGTSYRVRVRAKYGDEVSDWIFGTGTPNNAPQLTGLSMTTGGGAAVAFNATFSASKRSYTATVPYDTARVIVTPTWTATGATVSAGSTTANEQETVSAFATIASTGGNGTVDLDNGGTTHSTWVIVQIVKSGNLANRYRIVVRKAPAPPRGMVASSGNAEIPLSWTAPPAWEEVSGYQLDYTSSETVADDAASNGVDPSAAWIGGGTPSAGATSYTLPNLTNGTTYRVRLRAESGSINGAWAFGTNTPGKCDDPGCRLTGLTLNDGVRDLAFEPNNTWGSGFDPENPRVKYQVHAPPGVRSVTATPTWEDMGIFAVVMETEDATHGTGRRSRVTWTASESGTAKTLYIGPGNRDANGSTRLVVTVNGGAPGEAAYRAWVTHNQDWESANARLLQLELRLSE